MDLPDGEWVEFTSTLNHAQMRRIRRASSDPALDSFTEGVCAMITGWHLRDVDGQEVPCPVPSVDGIPSDALDTLPAVLVADVGARALEIAGGQPDPKGSTPRSSNSPTERRPASRPNSGTPTSSPTIPDGPGATSSPPLPI